MQFSEFLGILESHFGRPAQRSGSGYSCHCPAHDDENPSPSVSEGKEGKIFVHCFAGCSVEEICQSLNLQMSDLFIEPAHLYFWLSPSERNLETKEDVLIRKLVQKAGPIFKTANLDMPGDS